MSSTVTHTKILLLAKPNTPANALVSQLSQDAEILTVESFDEAVRALRDGPFDLVISAQSDFLALERAAINHQATMLLEHIGQGVGIVNLDGRMVWSNPKMQSYPADLLQQVADVCVSSIGNTEQERTQPAHHRARRFSLTGGQDQYFDLTITPILNSKHEISQVATVVWDVTASRRLQRKVDAIDLAGRELIRIDAETSAGMNVEQRIRLLEKKMLSYMHELLHFDNFAVLLIDKKTNKLEFVLQHGMAARTQDYDIYALPENNGISGWVAATGRSYICHDTSKEPRYLLGLESAKSSLTVPLRLRDKIIGVFNIESDKLAAFNEDDRQFAEILARYVAIALNTLDLLVMERYESTGRLADDVAGEIAGPINDILTEARSLMDEYISNDELRKKLSSICDNATEIKSRVKDVAKNRTGILGRHCEIPAADPMLCRRKVLVADDEQTIRETIADLLRKWGCEVDVAVDGGDAIAKIAQKKYELILADIRMPQKTGYDVFAAARDRDSAVPVILMTGFGYDPNHSIVRARSEGLNAVLFKPFKVDQLMEEVRKALLSPTPQ
jgi:CheY-like chemotaxis protein